MEGSKLSVAGSSQSILGEYLGLFASTEIFIFVFMEIVTKIETIQRVIFRKAKLSDYIVFILIYGLFSIFGTYIGIPSSYGSISNIRDLAPMVAGLVAGPYVGLAVGLIGGIHRFFLGGLSCIPCSMATVLAGLFAGLIYLLNKEKLLGIIPAMLFAVAIELIHAGLIVLLMIPYSAALDLVLTSIPEMTIANSLGLGICIIIVRSTKESSRPVT
jgi:sigma-B regulation protein RsbU (phosphoserine phosphatase)